MSKKSADLSVGEMEWIAAQLVAAAKGSISLPTQCYENCQFQHSPKKEGIINQKSISKIERTEGC